LIERANQKGGLDNITAIVVEVQDGASRPTPSSGPPNEDTGPVV
jgi:serine/threonine protein phosphatase PrpC